MVERNGKDYVFVAEGSGASATAKMAQIKPGIRVDQLMEVEVGLVDGEHVIITGQTLLDNGSKINVLSNKDSNQAGGSAADSSDGGNN
jgi:hypothetical protein